MSDSVKAAALPPEADPKLRRQQGGPLRTGILVGLVLALGFAAYIGTLWFQFVLDDRGQVVQNEYVHSWRYLTVLFTKQIWIFAAPRILANYYRPLFLVWFLLNHTFFGLNPTGWHGTTVLVHLAVTLMVYWLVRRIAQDRWVAVIAALVFGLHPAHIESVAWVSGVSDPLLALCLLPSFMFYVNWHEARPRRWVWLAASLLFYALALLSKETGVILPVLVFAYDWIWAEDSPGQSSLTRWRKRLGGAVLRILPYVFLTFLYAMVRSRVLGGFAHVVNPLPLSTILLTWPSLLWFYFKHLVWPFDLCVFYDLPYVTRPSSLNFILPMAGLGVVAAGLCAWHRGLSRAHPETARVLEFACVWLMVPFLPLADLSLFAKGETVHDRYLYLPLIGFGILVGLALRPLGALPVRAFGEPVFQWLAFLALAAFLGTATSNQESYWANDLLLYSRGVAKVPSSNAAVCDLASVYGGLGQYGAAVQLFHEVLARDPRLWYANYNLGYTYYQLGDFQGAGKYLRRAIALDGSVAGEYFYLGLTAMKQGHAELAQASFGRALQLDPRGLAYHFALGLLLEQKGDVAGALRQFELELANYPHEKAAKDQIERLKAQRLKLTG
jgi:hypothetical protein